MDRIVEKDGYKEFWLHNDQDFCGKILCFDLGKSSSLHYHKNKKEHFLVKSGTFVIQLYMGSPEDYFRSNNVQYPPELSGSNLMLMTNILLKMDQDLHIRRGQIHRIIAIEPESELIEFSTYHDDQDSYRVDLKRDWSKEDLLELAKFV